MKFAKTLERELSGDIPEEWVEAAIKYKALKKCIGKVVDELKFLGLEKNNLKLLINDKVVDVGDDQEEAGKTSHPNPIIAEYTLRKESPEGPKIQPMLNIILDFSNENLSDASITKTSNEIKSKLESLLNNEDASGQDEEKIIELKEENDGELRLVSSREGSLSPPSSPPLSPPPPPASEVDKISNNMDALVLQPGTSHKKREIHIVLNSDGKFFKMLEEELEALDSVRKTEESKIIDEVQAVADAVTRLSNIQAELYKWRELFKIYLDSEVYFRYNDQFREPRNEEEIKKQLDEFMVNANKSGVIAQFKKKTSLVAFNDFVAMNYHLFKLLQFQTINTEALRKILKKFDKQTSLGIQDIYPKLVSSDHIFVSGKSLAQSICFVIQNSILQLIPQIDDYSCPICMTIAFKPIRLSCGHVFCVRCLVKLKKDAKTNCPMCRLPDAIADADSTNLDLKNMALMKKYFPIEVKEKVRDRSKERFKEMKRSRGERCCIM
ncbi:uncharacterized protein LODBEIA_P56120 [Lodderomyces beijingensis]|uniref:RING-14 protein n=1 Tax=Lodderomyces beijingensis TaxID=1775926 RepID=A0ABP0ZUR7_9ASCO